MSGDDSDGSIEVEVEELQIIQKDIIELKTTNQALTEQLADYYELQKFSPEFETELQSLRQSAEEKLRQSEIVSEKADEKEREAQALRERIAACPEAVQTYGQPEFPVEAITAQLELLNWDSVSQYLALQVIRKMWPSTETRSIRFSNEQIQATSDEIAELHKQWEAIQKSKADYQKLVQTKEAEVRGMWDRVNDVNTQLQALDEQAALNEECMQDLAAKIETEEALRDSLKQSVTERRKYRQEFDNLVSEVENLRATWKKQQEDIEHVKQNGSLNVQKSELGKQYAQMTEDLNAISIQLQEKQVTIADLEKRKTQLQALLKEHKANIETLQDEITEKQEAHQELLLEIQSYQQMYEDSQAEIDRQRKNSAEELGALRTKASDLQTQIQLHTEQLEKAQKARQKQQREALLTEDERKVAEALSKEIENLEIDNAELRKRHEAHQASLQRIQNLQSTKQSLSNQIEQLENAIEKANQELSSVISN